MPSNMPSASLIQVFDPAMCCSTGLCGADVDQALVVFAADLDWLRRSGVHVERFNLAQQPSVFIENAVVREALDRSGQQAFPLVLVNGVIALSGRYPRRDELSRWAGLSHGASLPVTSVDQPKCTPGSGCC